MRFVHGLAVLIVLCAPADAATVRRTRHPHERTWRLDQPTASPKTITVPGWTDEETRQWLDNATGPKG